VLATQEPGNVTGHITSSWRKRRNPLADSGAREDP